MARRAFTAEQIIGKVRMHEIVRGFLAAMKKHGVDGLGPFRTVAGNENEVSYILIYESLAQREKLWEQLGADEDVRKLIGPFTEREMQGGPLLFSQVSKLLATG